MRLILVIVNLFIGGTCSAQFHQWSFDLGAAQDDFGNDVVVDASGNSYITGYFKSTVDFNPGSGTASRIAAGGHDVFVASYDASGNYRWASTMGGTQDDHGIKLCLDNNGHVNITGNIAGTADADPGGGVFTLSASNSGNGAFVWQLNAATGSFVSAMLIDASAQGNAIAVDSGGNIYITGVFNMNADFDPGSGTATLNTVGGNEDAFVAKYDNSLNYAWALALGGTGSDKGWSIATDANNNLYIGGYVTGNIDLDAGSGTTLSGVAGDYEGFIVSYNSSGQFVWGFGLHGTGRDLVLGLHINNALLYACGQFGGTVDFDPSGTTASQSSDGSSDAFFAQYTTAGTFNWSKRLGSGSQESAEDITTAANGDVYVTGHMKFDLVGTDFDPGSGVYSIQGFGGDDIFIARYTAQGAFTWAFAVGGSNANDAGSGIAVLGGDLWATGFFTGNPDFDPAGATAQLSAGVGADVFVAKYGTAFVGISENQTGLSATLFPNPATDLTTLQLNLETPGDVILSLFTISGKLISSENFAQRPSGIQALPVNFSGLAPGMYLLRMETADGTHHLRFCRQ